MVIIMLLTLDRYLSDVHLEPVRFFFHVKVKEGVILGAKRAIYRTYLIKSYFFLTIIRVFICIIKENTYILELT